jgi:hypothetical protein
MGVFVDSLRAERETWQLLRHMRTCEEDSEPAKRLNPDGTFRSHFIIVASSNARVDWVRQISMSDSVTRTLSSALFVTTG